MNLFGRIQITVWFLLLADSGWTQATAADPTTPAALIEQCQAQEDNDPTAAMDLAQQVMSMIQAETQPIQYGQALGCLGWAQASSDLTEAARASAYALENLALNLPDSLQGVKLQRRAGSVFHRIGDRISAAENYDAAMVEASRLSLVEEQIPLLVNLGVLNSEMREHEQAIETYYEALNLMETHEDFRYQPPVLFNLAATLNGQQRFTEALKLFQQVAAMINEHWPKSRVAQVYSGLAASYTGLDQLTEALDYAEQSMAIYQETGSFNVDYHNVMSTVASILSMQGEQLAALDHADRVKAYFTDPANKQAVTGSTNPVHNLASTYARLGHQETAIEMYRLAIEIDREVQENFNQQIMAQMQVRLDDSQNRQELAALKSQRVNDQIQIQAAEHNRKIMLVIASALALMLLVFLWWQQLTKKKLTQMAMTDSLTQVGNRRAIRDWVLTRKPSVQGQRLLWLVDLDDFRTINDEHNHDYGDFVLQQVAAALQQLTNAQRFLGRWGGEEFMLITDDITAAEKDDFSTELLRVIANTPTHLNGAEVKLSAAVGLSRVGGQSPSAWNMAMYQADKALATAKHRGSNCVVMATGN
ncbi:tetratricopeptide repeat-containing diguanylate cyclase [Marinicella meishanensis]|uniref:tetratricopeptide repeat-containing diguanylate cyclase n=1 Tax=Marinicella meishanensis TaxID=2873263 RepID=UPI001CBFA380|nr:diguanylate cyclase [Marinicella sp. NBU2979]